MTQISIKFAEDIVQGLLRKKNLITRQIKKYLQMIIMNTKEGDETVLSLADACVLTGFYI